MEDASLDDFLDARDSERDGGEAGTDAAEAERDGGEAGTDDADRSVDGERPADGHARGDERDAAGDDQRDADASDPAATAAVDPAAVDTATTTCAWTADGEPCGSCGDLAERRWRGEAGLVCPDCKDW
jgi:hypothetical protein